MGKDEWEDSTDDDKASNENDASNPVAQIA